MPPHKPCLTGMPKEVMRHIVGYLDLLAVLNLRKTCHDLRDFIIEIKPPSNIRQIDAVIDLDKITLDLNFDDTPREFNWEARNTYHISYEKCGAAVYVRWKLKSYVEPKWKYFQFVHNNLDVFSPDFGTILALQRTPLRSLSLLFHYPNDNKKRDVHKVFDCFKGLTTNYKEFSLKVTSLHLACKGEHEVLEVLPFCDPQHIESLKIDVGKKHGRLELQEIIYLEQWTNAKEVELIGCFAHYSHFEHFEKVDVAIQTVTTEDIMEIKEIFFQQPHMSHICIKFQHYYTENDLTQRFGEPFIATDEWGNNPYNIWYLRIPGGREVMKMQYRKGAGTTEHRDLVSMDRILAGDVPGFANIVDVE